MKKTNQSNVFIDGITAEPICNHRAGRFTIDGREFTDSYKDEMSKQPDGEYKIGCKDCGEILGSARRQNGVVSYARRGRPEWCESIFTVE